MSRTYRILLLFWGVLLIISLGAVLLNLSVLPDEDEAVGEVPGEPQEPESEKPPPDDLVPTDDRMTLNLGLAILTAVTSAGGFIVTTIFALREDRRDSVRHALEVKYLQKEIAQRDLEIAELRRKKERPGQEGE